MKKRFILACIALGITALNAQSQEKMEQDRQAILEMKGCHKVTFNYAETFSPNKDYEFHENETSWAKEYVIVVEDEPGHIALQHLLIVGEESHPHIIKHWRQDWDYENTDFYMFQKYDPTTKMQSWKYIKMNPEEVKGQWTQKVYQVDDSPRYEGTATWVHFDGRHYWENTTDAPLPRREYSKRRDYNIVERQNHQEITGDGWVHEQDNKKILREEGGKDVWIASEKGWNTYDKIDEKECQAAANWWKENHKVWKNVRQAWKNRFDEKRDLYLTPNTREVKMYEDFFALEQDASVKEVEALIKKWTK